MRPFSPAWWRRERARASQSWYLWPLGLFMAVYGLVGVAWCLYRHFWVGASFTSVWTGFVLSMTAGSRRAWQDHRIKNHGCAGR